MCNGSLWAPLTVMAFTILLIRIHPEPADACCKCFEDGVAFAGVFIGVKFGMWRNPVLNIHGESTSDTAPIVISLLKLLIKIVVGTKFPQHVTNGFQESLYFLRGEQQQSLSFIEFYLHFIDCLKRLDSTCPVDTL